MLVTRSVLAALCCRRRCLVIVRHDRVGMVRQGLVVAADAADQGSSGRVA
jgi:hypothetical protein